MKLNICKTALFILLFIILIRPTQSQILKNNWVIWGSAGPSFISNGAAHTSVSGHTGTALGGGYELQRNRFLFQIGAELISYKSAMALSDTTFMANMTDTEGDNYKGIFTFRNISDKQQLINLGIPVLAGYNSPVSGFYFMTGAKVLLHLQGSSNTISRVTTQAVYDNIIGQNGDGLLTDMPNHGLSTENRTVKSNFRLSTAYTATLEIGYSFRKYPEQKEKHHWRVALFCDYSVFPVQASRQTNQLFVNTTGPDDYKPAINNLIFNQIPTGKITSVFTGLKVYYIINIPKRYNCRCESQQRP